jgi:hypothetical protein
MAAQRGEGSVDLFGQHGTSKFVWESHGGKREQDIGARFPIGWQSIVPANEKDQVLRLVLSPRNELNEGWGIELAASGIEEYLTSAGVFGKQVEALRNNLAHLALGIAAGALEKLCRNAVRMKVARFADVIDEELHALYSMAETRQSKLGRVPVRRGRR